MMIKAVVTTKSRRGGLNVADGSPINNNFITYD